MNECNLAPARAAAALLAAVAMAAAICAASPHQAHAAGGIAVGDTVVYAVEQQVNTLGVDAYSRYDNFEIADVIPDGLDYASCRLVDDKGSNITSEAGKATYAASSRTLTYRFSPSFLAKMPMRGERYKLEITCVVSSPGRLVNTGTSKFNTETLKSNSVVTEVPAASLAVKKTSPRDAYSAGDAIPYRIEVVQTAAGAAVRDVRVSDPAPAGMAPVPGSAKAGGVAGASARVEGGSVVASAPRLEAGQTLVVECEMRLSDGAALECYVNTAVAAGRGVPDAEGSCEVEVDGDVRFFVDGEPEPAHVDGGAVRGSPYDAPAAAFEAGRKPGCSGFSGWYTDPSCTEPYRPDSDLGRSGGGFDLYGYNICTVSTATADTEFARLHAASMYADESLTRPATFESLYPAAFEVRYGETVSFDQAYSLWYLADDAAREAATGAGVYASPSAEGTQLNAVRVLGDAVVYKRWDGDLYDGVKSGW